MTSPRGYIAIPLLLAAAGGGYWLYNANAIQAGGALAQVPLNSAVSVPPGFVMAVDDSGSMTFQTLFPGQDGSAFWNPATANTNGYFTGTGANAVLRTSGTEGSFHYVIPSQGFRINGYDRRTIAPIDRFGFARSSDYNPAYFNPIEKYLPWKKPNPTTKVIEDYPQANVDRTLANPDGTAWIQLSSADVAWPGWASTGGDDYFTVPNGATLPKGTYYHYNFYTDDQRNCGGLTSSNDWRTLPNDLKLSATCEVGIRYYPATFYLKTNTVIEAPETKPADYFGYKAAPVAIANACGDGCTLYRYEIRPGNFQSTAQFDKARQSFANWFSFYGNRNRSLKAAMTIALEGTEKMRVGLFTINGGLTNVTMRDMSVVNDKAALYTEKLLTVGASGGTPNRAAVDWIGKQFMRTGENVPVKYACQINAGMLFTDGYSNQGGPATGSQDADMPPPLRDNFANTLADTAAYYYKINLRPDLPTGKVAVPEACRLTPNDPKLDCRADPHMNFYGVTLGAKGDIYGQTYNPNTNTPDPYDGSWQPPWRERQDDRPSTVDEIWHATMNSRGQFINATTPSKITDAMRAILASVGGSETPSGTLGLTGSRIGKNSLVVVPKYTPAGNGTDWFSYLNASTLTGNPVTGLVTETPKWEAAVRLEGAGRNIRFGKTTAGSVVPAVTDFQASALGANDAEVLAALCSDPLQNCAGKFNRINGGVTGAQAVEYLRGSRTLDGTKLRKRTTLLGDIVNSTPLLSSFSDDYGYTGLRNNDNTGFDVLHYGEYLKSKRPVGTAEKPPLVLVGANDGMFHAFDGATGDEKFAYIPATSVGHMGNLLFPYRPQDRNDQVFQHRFYVDGLITVSDAHDGAAWRTVAAASVGAGGRGVFAIDLTDGASNVLWEINDKVSEANGGKDIGSVLGKIAIVPVKQAGNQIKWKAIFGNGYDSVNGKAVLFMVDIADGTVTRITAQETGANLPTRTKNGLGNLIAIDRYKGTTSQELRDGFADTVYAGDLNGAVWKFDLRDNSVAFGGNPLFVARYNDDYNLRQPILGGFEATLAGDNVMVYFGSGSFSFVEDPTDNAMQTVYGVIDSGVPVTGRGELQAQYAYRDPSTSERLVTKDRLNATKKGWYLNLGVDADGAGGGAPIATGERFVGNPRIQNGILFFPTYDPVASDGCATSGNNWLYGLNALSGGANMSNGRLNTPTGQQLGTDTGAIKPKPGDAGASTAPNKDIAVVASARGDNVLPANADPQTIKDAIASKCSVMVQTAGSPPIYLPRPCGRQSWRQLR